MYQIMNGQQISVINSQPSHISVTIFMIDAPMKIMKIIESVPTASPKDVSPYHFIFLASNKALFSSFGKWNWNRLGFFHPFSFLNSVMYTVNKPDSILTGQAMDKLVCSIKLLCPSPPNTVYVYISAPPKNITQNCSTTSSARQWGHLHTGRVTTFP